MKELRAAWGYLRGASTEREMTIRMCRHDWDPATMRCRGLCGATQLEMWSVYIVADATKAMAALAHAAQVVTRAMKGFSARA